MKPPPGRVERLPHGTGGPKVEKECEPVALTTLDGEINHRAGCFDWLGQAAM